MNAFVRGMLDAFANTSSEPATTAPRRESDRQPDAPPGWAVGALRWSPKPSAAAVVAIGLAAAAQRALRGPAAQG
jgi:protease I